MSEATCILEKFYHHYLANENVAQLIARVTQVYRVGTLERLARYGQRNSRRAAVLVLGMIGGYESNAVIGCALSDRDRGVRMVADNCIRGIWKRAAGLHHQRALSQIEGWLAAGRYADSVMEATRLIVAAPSYAEAWNLRGIAHFERGFLSAAIRDSHWALELNPYHFPAAVGMGQCYLQLDQPVSALDCFRRALRLNPDLENVRSQVMHLERASGG